MGAELFYVGQRIYGRTDRQTDMTKPWPFDYRNFAKRLTSIFYYIFNKMQRYTVYFIWKLLYMFRVVPPPIIRSANNCIYSIWYLSPLLLPAAIVADSSNGVTNTDAVDTVVGAPDDGWWYHPKHVEQFPDKINCVTLHLVGYILEYT